MAGIRARAGATVREPQRRLRALARRAPTARYMNASNQYATASRHTGHSAEAAMSRAVHAWRRAPARRQLSRVGQQRLA